MPSRLSYDAAMSLHRWNVASSAVVTAVLVALLAGSACRRGGSGPSTVDGVPAAAPAPPDGATEDADAGPSGPTDEAGAPPLDVVDVPPREAEPAVESLEEFRRQLRPVYCDHQIRCGLLGESQRAACVAGDGTLRPDPVFGLWDELGFDREIAEGRLVYDSVHSGECLTFWRDTPCRWDPATSPPFGCIAGWPPFRPGAAAGGACRRWDECIDGYCTAQTACEGTCKARVATGAACGSNGLCLEQDFCLEDVCTPRRGEGEECPGDWQACRPGLWCEGYVPENDDPEWWHPAVPGKCALPKGVGFRCATSENDEHCRADLFCDWGMREPECRERLPRDAECRWLHACADGLTCAGLKLGGHHPAGRRYDVLAAGRCLPHLDAGSACDPDADVSGCPDSMTCDTTSRTCRSTGWAGDPCESSWIPPGTPEDRPLRRRSCRGGLYCDPETRTCHPQLATDERCTPRPDGEDETCFMGECDPHRHRCAPRCGET
jgi:hypothetical protein